MGLLRRDVPQCPAGRHCAQWFREHMQYCLCSTKDGISLSLGVVSVVSWGVAEIPQIVTNYKLKSAEGLSLAFLTTWILGDLFNLFGCMLEPATTILLTSYNVQLYTIATWAIFGQTVYYGHIYPRLKYRRPFCKIIVVCFRSARSFSSSHTPIAGSCFPQRMSPKNADNQGTFEEPLLAGDSSEQSTPSPKTKNMLCLVSLVMFFGTFNLPKPVKDRASSVSRKHSGRIMQVGRKLLQVNDGMLQENGFAGNSGVGTFLGWAMAAIYMGGRLPQICLNIRRGKVEGLNPWMFLLALIGNITYVASILVSSLDWSKIRPNLPWLVESSGCALLDIFVSLSIQLQMYQYTYSVHLLQLPEETRCQNYS
ncbi:hypothetical protein EUGRSUZ_A02168 [Eucalyptus grandis]|uniref:Uncharacterized protein n=2 Tax=Eucalyptus grandis TaxID=71139 RepID=A0ACC3M5P3_EUCGR|nr:hypothetical protein EUGRSUZ_A02168 [Eucalyptus grandis]